MRIGDGLVARKQTFGGSKSTLAIVSYEGSRHGVGMAFADQRKVSRKVI